MWMRRCTNLGSASCARRPPHDAPLRQRAPGAPGRQPSGGEFAARPDATRMRANPALFREEDPTLTQGWETALYRGQANNDQTKGPTAMSPRTHFYLKLNNR